MNQCWHNQPIESILTQWETNIETGLSQELVKKRQEIYGKNIIPETPPRSGLSIFINYFKSFPVALLGVAALLSLVTGKPIDSGIIMGVVIINAIIGYVTESQSERIITSLAHLVNPSALVIREGKAQEIEAQDLVLGDIVLLKPGIYIPADVRLIECTRLTIDESALTGESIPILKNAHHLTNRPIPLAEKTNMVYRGTFVTGGQGMGIVVATGENTEMGKIQTLVGKTIVPQTPMERQLERAGSQLITVSGVVCIFVFILGLLRGYELLEMLTATISLAVAAIPEGLPTVAITTLALGIRNMRKHHVLIRRLDAVEALGSVGTICLDKTGTLTRNQMQVAELSIGDRVVKITPEFLSQRRKATKVIIDESLEQLVKIAVLCSETDVKLKSDGEYEIDGSSTEKALVEMALGLGMDVVGIKATYPLIQLNHRSQEQNYMTTLHPTEKGNILCAVKGNPIEVLSLCHSYLVDEQILPLTETQRAKIEAQNQLMAGKALRVLGFAYSVSATAAHYAEHLIWLGLIGMTDPIRDGVNEFIANFHKAGISTVMLTGDQKSTAYAIGKELNLSQDKELKILESKDLINVTPETIQELCQEIHVFARITPANKLEIVQALQSANHVVAMTGDGINDAPALKAAQVGIAMGNSGTDVAREVADVVLENDDLETMITAVSLGRTTYNNIRKAVHFLISTNLSEIIVMFLANAIGLGQPLNAIQLLWLNLVTDIFPGVALAMEPPEPDVLQYPPRPPEEPLLKSQELKRVILESIILSVSALTAYSYGIYHYGMGNKASTIGFMSLVIAQLLHSLTCRSQNHSLLRDKPLAPNPYLSLALSLSLGLQLICLFIPSLGSLLKLTPLSLLDGLIIATSALIPLLINEATKNG